MTESHHDDHGRESKTGFWLPPYQRQKWSDTQILPHVNWGDLFFDLFYVAAAYNLALLLKEDKGWTGIFYFLACFGPLYTNFWNYKTIFDARFGFPNDVLHPVLEVVQLCALATAVLHIRPVEEMSRPANTPETFLFCLANTLGLLYILFTNCEIRFIWVEGETVPSRHMAEKDLKHNRFTLCIVLAATLWSGVLYLSNDGTASEMGEVNHGPMILMILSWATKPWIMYLFYVVLSPKDFKKYSVPINIEFCIHRYGEWTMLMLGESILSLLIVNDVPSSQDYVAKYYTTFYVGVVSVTLLQYLYFKSQPHSADHHAMRRTRISGFSYGWITQLYSAALIVVGVSYKMILTEYTLEYEQKYGLRIAESSSSTSDGYRSLATKDDYDQASSYYEQKKLLAKNEARQGKIAWFFGLSLGLTFLFLDLMLLAHNGVEGFRTRSRCPTSGNIRLVGFVLVVVSRILITAFIMTLGFYYSEPNAIAWLGLTSIVLQIIVRVLGNYYYPQTIIVHKVDGVRKEISLREETKIEANVALKDSQGTADC